LYTIYKYFSRSFKIDFSSYSEVKTNSPARILASLLYVQKNHDIVRVDVKLKSVVGKNVVIAQAALDALQLESWMHREQTVLVEFDRHGRQSGRSGGAVGHSDGSFDLALVAWSAHVIRAEVAQVDDPSKY